MEARGLFPARLGSLLGVSHTTVARWLAGAEPRQSHVEHLTHVLNVSAQWLLNGSGEMQASFESDRVADTPISYSDYNSKPAQIHRELDSPLPQEMILPMLLSTMERMKTCSDPVTRVALASNLRRMASELESIELAKVAAGYPEGL